MVWRRRSCGGSPLSGSSPSSSGSVPTARGCMRSGRGCHSKSSSEPIGPSTWGHCRLACSLDGYTPGGSGSCLRRNRCWQTSSGWMPSSVGRRPASRQQLMDAQRPSPHEGPQPLHAVDEPSGGVAPRPHRWAAGRHRSSVGTLEAPLQVTNEVREGVVSLPHGYGHGRDGTWLSVANANPGVSIAINGLPVTVESANPDLAHGPGTGRLRCGSARCFSVGLG
jgi:hypothetical protein